MGKLRYFVYAHGAMSVGEFRTAPEGAVECPDEASARATLASILEAQPKPEPEPDPVSILTQRVVELEALLASAMMTIESTKVIAEETKAELTLIKEQKETIPEEPTKI